MAIEARTHVHKETTASTTIKYLPSAMPTSKNIGTLLTYTRGARSVEVGLMAMVGLVGTVAFLL